MKEISLTHLPPRSVAYLVVSVFLVVALILFAIVPMYRYMGEMDRRIARTGQRIETEKSLFPLYQQLVKRSRTESPAVLPLPERVPLPKKQLDGIPSMFEGMGHRAGMEMVSAAPDVTTLSPGRNRMLIQATLRGEFFNFRKFLIELGRIPYVERVGEIQIRYGQPGREFRVKVWISVS